MNIGVLGSGPVAQTLASGFLVNGYDVTVATRSPSKLDEWLGKNPGGAVGSFADAAAFGDLIVLAVEGLAALDVLNLAGAENLDGKTVIDTTNPIDKAAPTHGVLKYFTDYNESLLERLQSQYHSANFVKAFNSVGSASMVNPKFNGGPPTMFICGNNESAKSTVKTILSQFGWETEDLGAAEAARAIEPLCILWCIPGFLHNDWVHAFKLLR